MRFIKRKIKRREHGPDLPSILQGLKDDPDLRGVIPNSFAHIFSHISRSQEQQYLVRASYLEIYQEDIRDLLAKDQSKTFELKVTEGLSEGIL